MVCYAVGRCRICARRHTMPIFGSDENQHALIEILKLRLIILKTVCADCIEKFKQVVKGKESSVGNTRSACQPKYGDIDVRPAMHFYVESGDNKSAKAESPKKSERLSPQNNFTHPEKTTRTQREQDTTPLTNPVTTQKTKNLKISKKVRASRRVQCRLCCDYCEKEFTHKGDWKRHNRKHTGEKPYECMECSKKFSQLSNLSRHRLVHSGERPFACAQCGQSYSRKGRLINHIRHELCRRNSRQSQTIVTRTKKMNECNS